MIHRRTHPQPVAGCYACKLAGLDFRAASPSPKQTVDRTDTAFITTTEHWHDSQDVNVALTHTPTGRIRNAEEV